MHGTMRWDGQSSNHTFQLLSKHGVSPCSATLHECQMKQMPRRSWQLPPLRTGGDHQDVLVLRGLRLSTKTWNPITSPWMKQSLWLRIVHSGDWCLCFVLCTPSGACRKRRMSCEWAASVSVSLGPASSCLQLSPLVTVSLAPASS